MYNLLLRAQECAGKENGSQGRTGSAGGGSSMLRGGTGDTTIKEDEPGGTTLEILLRASLGIPGGEADVHSMEDMDTGGRGLHRMEKDMVARNPIAGRGLHRMEKGRVAVETVVTATVQTVVMHMAAAWAWALTQPPCI